MPESGVLLDNGFLTPQTPARTIINEVTAPNPSVLKGPLEVLGNKAHVIIANPYGISVDGATFINTGGLALTTGEITNAGASPEVQVRQGVLTVEGDGLVGTFSHLQLLAKELRLDGPVTNEAEDPDATTTLIAGDSDTTFTNLVAPGDSSAAWSATADPGSANAGAILIDITENGTITGGRIQVAITDDGAGMRHAGSMVADLNDFTLSVDGTIELDGGTIDAATDAVVTAEGVTLNGGRIAAAEGGLLVESTAGNIENNGGTLQGKTRIAANPGSQGGVTLISSADILNKSMQASYAIAFGSEDDLYVQAAGDITNDQGRLLSNASVTIDAGGDFNNMTERVGGHSSGSTYTEEKRGRRSLFTLFLGTEKVTRHVTEYGTPRVEKGGAGSAPVVFAGDSLTINADNINNQGGEISANNGDLFLNATNNVNNEAYIIGTAWYEKRCNWFFCSERAWSDTETMGGAINAGNNMSINAGGALHNGGGQFYAVNDMTINTTNITTGSNHWMEYSDYSTGLRGAWSEYDVRMRAIDQGGSFIANMGRLTINSGGPIDLSGGEVSGGDGIDIPNGYTNAGSSTTPAFEDIPSIGVFGGVL